MTKHETIRVVGQILNRHEGRFLFGMSILATILAFVPASAAGAATVYQDPAASGSNTYNGWYVLPNGSGAVPALNDSPTTYPSQPSIADLIGAGDGFPLAELATSDTALGSASVTYARLWVHRWMGAYTELWPNVLVNGAYATADPPSLDRPESRMRAGASSKDWAWVPVELTEALLDSEAELAAARIRFKRTPFQRTDGTWNEQNGHVWVNAAYIEVQTQEPPPQAQTLTVAPTGEGGGTISGSGISCPGDCSETYPYGTSVSLNTSPSSTAVFTGWGGNCSDSGACAVSMTSPRSVTANFRLSTCPLDYPVADPRAEAGLAPSADCTLHTSDTGDASQVTPPATYPWGLWGGHSVWDCPDPSSQYQNLSDGTNWFHRLTVIRNGTRIDERCELGRNDRSSTFMTYQQGQRRLTYVSVRIPQHFQISADTWQVVTQFKHANPSNFQYEGESPPLALSVRNGGFHISTMNGGGFEHWFPDEDPNPDPEPVDGWRRNQWIRFVWDVTYSICYIGNTNPRCASNPVRPSVQVSADLNGDGDLSDPGERSPRFSTANPDMATLATERDPKPGEFVDDGLVAGDPIPSHLRVGLYSDPSVDCPQDGTGGPLVDDCWVDIDDVRVYGP